MNISDYLRNGLLCEGLGISTPFSNPSSPLWAALYNVAPISSGGGVEVTAVDYERVQVDFVNPSTGQGQSSADVRFPVSGQTLNDWGVVVALGVFDASTNGHLLWFGPLSASLALPIGSDFKIPAGDLTVTLS